MEWKGATGRVRGGALLDYGHESVSPPNDPKAEGILGAGASLLQSPPLGVGTCWNR